MTNLKRIWIPFVGALILVAATVKFATTESEATVPPSGVSDSYLERFTALDDFTPAVADGLSELESERLSFRTQMMAHARYAKEGIDPSHAEPLKVEKFGRVALDEGQGWVDLAAIGDNVCAWQVRGAGICGTPQQIESSGVATSSQVGQDKWQVVALVPSGVTEIAAEWPGSEGTSFRTGVHSGVYSGYFPTETIKITGYSKSGEGIFSDEIPLDEFVEGSPSDS